MLLNPVLILPNDGRDQFLEVAELIAKNAISEVKM